MRISDLARAAGVTVRTLRHYYQIGILAEPERDQNNYRRYNARHLVRVLRIKRLSALGFSLSSITRILGSSGDAVETALAALDRDLEAQIARLTRQRELIAALNSSQSTPDTPIELAQYHEALSSAMPDDIQEARLEHLVLLAHVVGHDGLPAVSNLYRNLTSPENLARMLELELRFYNLDETSSKQTLDRLVDDFVQALGPVVADTTSPENLRISSRGVSILNDHILTITNTAQRTVIRNLTKQLEA